MSNFEKIVKITDAVFDCIPIVSSVTNIAHGIYKLAHKVDTLKPVAPGLKTSIKIHSLSKDKFDCFIGAMPILGNIFKLIEFIQRAIHRFDYTPRGILGPTRDDDLLTAVCRHNKEIVHLSLANKALDDLDRADRVLSQAAFSSNNEIFNQILHHRQDWSTKSLIKALGNLLGRYSDESVRKANSILDYWDKYKQNLDISKVQVDEVINIILKDFLERNRTALAERIIGILPTNIPFEYLQEILFKYSCARYNYRDELEKTGVLTAEGRNALIAKSTKPSLEQLEKYYSSVAYQLENNRTENEYRDIHFNILNRLLDIEKLQDNEINEFIVSTLTYDAFIEPIVGKYEKNLTLPSKIEILKRLLPYNSNTLASHKKRVQLFASWIDKWKNDISEEADQLYTEISNTGEVNIQRAQFSQKLPPTTEEYESIELLKFVNNQFKKILVHNFPGCEQISQKKAV